MSGHAWRNKEGQTCVVGWDNPLQSYFWQIMQDGEEIDGSKLGMPGLEITSIDDLVAQCRFMIGPWTLQELEADKADSPGPSPLQMQMRAMMNNDPA